MHWVNTKDMIEGEVYRVGFQATDFEFLGFRGRDILASYKGTNHTLRARTNIVKVTNTKEETMKKLYEITTSLTTSYGHKLAVDSSGNWVMEIKGSGEVKSYPKELITEVVPYSVSVKFSDSPGAEYDYFAVKGDWTVGDVVLLSDRCSVAIIKGIDTKSAKATKWITGFKLQGEFIKSGE